MMQERWIGRGRFEVRATLGAGAFGTVFAAMDHERGHLVALKRPHHHAAETLLRFKREFRALADLSHPNLISLFELLEDAGQWFFTMELVEGVPLTYYLRHALDTKPTKSETIDRFSFDALGRTLDGSQLSAGVGTTVVVAPPDLGEPVELPDLERLRTCFVQVTRALIQLHSNGLLHRDIKPSNVLVTPQGRVVVLDFGLVRTLRHAPAEDAVAGTPLYMAPEQWLGEPVDASADWYSVGVMLYEALLGRPPFVGDLVGLVQAKIAAAFRPPTDCSPDVPPELDQLCRDLLAPTPHTRPHGTTVLATLAGPDDSDTNLTLTTSAEPPLIGRTTELQTLHAAHASLALGGPAVVHLCGEAGIGKSALCAAFLDQLAEQGACILRGRCFEQESVPYKALDAVIDELCRTLQRFSDAERQRLLPPDAGLLARTFPVLEKLVGSAEGSFHPGAPDMHPVTLRRRIFAVLRELLRRLGQTTDLVIAVDDLQWGDRESAALVHWLLRPPDPPRLLLVLSYREDDGAHGPFVRELQALETEAGPLPHRQVLRLTRLNEADAAALVDAVSTSVVAAPRRAGVVQASQGLPRLLDQLARMVTLADSSSASRQFGEVGDNLIANLLARQMASLSATSRHLLELVAVAAVPTSLPVLAAAAGLVTIDRAMLTPLRSAHLVRLVEGDDERLLAPAYNQLAAALLEQLAPANLRAHHRALATALATTTAAPRRVALHFSQAGLLDRANHFIRIAARQAANALAFEEAAACWALALQWDPNAADRRTLLRSRADALVNAGHCRDAAPIYLDLVADAPATEAFELRRLAAEQLLSCGELEHGEATLRSLTEAQDLGYPASNRAAMISIAYNLVRLKFRGTDFLPQPAETLGPERLATLDTCLAAARNLTLARSIYSMRFSTLALRLALDLGERERVVEALAATGGALSLTGDATGRQLFEQAEALAQVLGTPRARGLVALWQGFHCHGQARWADARERWETASNLLAECRGLTTELLRAQTYVLLALVHQGDFAELALRTDAAMAMARATGNLYTEVTALTYAAFPRLAAGDLGGARTRLHQAEIRSPNDNWNMFSRMKLHVQCSLYAGESAAALARLDASQPAIEASRMRSFGIFRIVVSNLHAGAALQAHIDGGLRTMTLIKLARRELARFHRDTPAFAQGYAALLRSAVANLAGDRAAAIQHCLAAIEHHETCVNWMEAVSAKRRLGQLQGGTTGQATIASADATMRARGIAEPARWTACFAPGFANDFGDG